MSSNIEPLARAMAERICRSHRMSESEIQDWVDHHWEVAAAMLESGAMDETGEWQPGQDWRRGLEAYRERLAASPYRKPRSGSPLDSPPKKKA